MIHSLSRSSSSKPHFCYSWHILGISWHILKSKIFASPGIPGDQTQGPKPPRSAKPSACRSGPKVAVPGNTRSLEVVVKPAKWSSSTAWIFFGRIPFCWKKNINERGWHGDSITRNTSENWAGCSTKTGLIHPLFIHIFAVIAWMEGTKLRDSPMFGEKSFGIQWQA